MNNEKKLNLVRDAANEILIACENAPIGWDTWVSVNEEGEVYTSYQTTNTIPHPDNDDYCFRLSWCEEPDISDVINAAGRALDSDYPKGYY